MNATVTTEFQLDKTLKRAEETERLCDEALANGEVESITIDYWYLQHCKVSNALDMVPYAKTEIWQKIHGKYKDQISKNKEHVSGSSKQIRERLKEADRNATKKKERVSEEDIAKYNEIMTRNKFVMPTARISSLCFERLLTLDSKKASDLYIMFLSNCNYDNEHTHPMTVAEIQEKSLISQRSFVYKLIKKLENAQLIEKVETHDKKLRFKLISLAAAKEERLLCKRVEGYLKNK